MAVNAVLTNGGVNCLDRELISKAEFARRIGVSRPRVTILAQQGRLILEGELVVWPDSNEAYLAGRDPDRTLESATNPAVQPKNPRQPTAPALPSKVEKVKHVKRQRDTAAERLLDEGEDDIIAVSKDSPMAHKLVAAKHMQSFTKARLAQIELFKERGRLLLATEVQDDAENAAIELKTKLMNVPARCAVRCEGKTAAEIEVIMQEEIIACMKVLHSSKFMKDFV